MYTPLTLEQLRTNEAALRRKGNLPTAAGARRTRGRRATTRRTALRLALPRFGRTACADC